MAYIFLTTVLFLALKPAIDYVVDIGCHEVSCCVDECNPFLAGENSSDNDSNDCDGNSCNPFQACGTSFVTTTNVADFTFHVNKMLSLKKFNYEVNYASQFLPEFWQPPKIV